MLSVVMVALSMHGRCDIHKNLICIIYFLDIIKRNQEVEIEKLERLYLGILKRPAKLTPILDLCNFLKSIEAGTFRPGYLPTLLSAHIINAGGTFRQIVAYS
jgi:predicted AAA+ superfamily ATPase